MTNLFKKIFGVVVLCFIAGILIIGVGVNQFFQAFFRAPNVDASTVTFVIQDGESFSTIASHLQEQQIIANAFWFKVAGKFAGLADKMKTGNHQVQPGLNYSSLLAKLATSVPDEVSITIPEGYSLFQIGTVINEKLGISAADWEAATGISSPLKTHPFFVSAGAPLIVDLEGYLFPDTYRFFPNATASDVAQKMLDTMQQKVATLDEPTGNARGYSIHELLTVASIVQKEATDKSDMADIADVFFKRLRDGMALQSDATVNYATGAGDPAKSVIDISFDSLYNTYNQRGLMPGPICNSGLDAVEATFHPKSNDYYYFLTDQDGIVHFAKTFAEHTLNVNKYLR